MPRQKQSFEVGDTVQLKSGGPKMTVNNPSYPYGAHGGQVECQWFVGSKLNTGYFAADSLKVYDETDESPK